MSSEKKVSMAVIKRLPRYYRYLGDLMDKGIVRISSKELAGRMGITASQIRQDLNNFGSYGQQGYGYNVLLLYKEIARIIGLEKSHNLIIIGAGTFGQTLANYANFGKRGYNFTALFDIDPDIIGKTVGGVKVQDVANLADFLAQNHVDIAALTLPANATAQVAAILAESHVLGIWNFSDSDLALPEHITVENVRLTDSLMTLAYKLNEEEILRRVEN